MGESGCVSTISGIVEAGKELKSEKTMAQQCIDKISYFHTKGLKVEHTVQMIQTKQ